MDYQEEANLSASWDLISSSWHIWPSFHLPSSSSFEQRFPILTILVP